MSTVRTKKRLETEKRGLLSDDRLEQQSKLNQIEMEEQKKKTSPKATKTNGNVVNQSKKAEQTPANQNVPSFLKDRKQTATMKEQKLKEKGIDPQVLMWTNPNGPFKFSLGFEKPGVLSIPMRPLNDAPKMKR